MRVFALLACSSVPLTSRKAAKARFGRWGAELRLLGCMKLTGFGA